MTLTARRYASIVPQVRVQEALEEADGFVLIPGRNSPVRVSCMPPACHTGTASNVNGAVAFDVRSLHE